MKIRILQNGTGVVVLKDGTLLFEGPWDKMLEVGQAIVRTAHLAEEWAKALDIARDNAILIRAGVPVGLTNHPDIKKESVRIAVNDRNLRRYMPDGVRSKEVFGVPTVILGRPK